MRNRRRRNEDRPRARGVRVTRNAGERAPGQEGRGGWEGRGGRGGRGGGNSGGGGGDFDQSAFDLMRQMLNEVGLGSLTGPLRQMIVDGLDTASIQLQLQETEEWKRRFAGNEIRRQNGLNVLSVDQYLAQENQYAEMMAMYGLPPGFYDDPSDYADYIGKSISPNELNQRLSAWEDVARREDTAVKDQLRSMGIADGDLLAYMIDPDRALPLIQQRQREALVGAAARRVGLDASNASRWAQMGIGEERAVQAFGLISETLGDTQRLGDIYGVDYDQDDAEAEAFLGDGDAARKRKRLASQERANFSGSSGVGMGSLSRDASGSY